MYVGRNRRKFKLHASQTASESSTIAEEIVVLLRRLHPLPAWNPLINQYISRSLQTIPKLITQTTGDTSSFTRREQQVHVRLIIISTYQCNIHEMTVSVFSPSKVQGTIGECGVGGACSHIKAFWLSHFHIKGNSVLKACWADMP